MATIDLAQAAEAIVFMHQMFTMDGAEDIDDWIEELKDKWPELAAAVSAHVKTLTD